MQEVLFPEQPGAFDLAGTRTSALWLSKPPGHLDDLNLRAVFPSSNEWGIPDVAAEYTVPERMLAWTDRAALADAGPNAAAHSFLDDYRFESMWARAEKSVARLKTAGCMALSPDFSLWRGAPWVVQSWQVYRSRWCAAWWQSHGVRVICTAQWAGPETFGFAFGTMPHGCPVAVSAVGVVRDRSAHAGFQAGLSALAERVAPSVLLVYGKLPPGADTHGVPVRLYPTRWQGADGSGRSRRRRG